MHFWGGCLRRTAEIDTLDEALLQPGMAGTCPSAVAIPPMRLSSRTIAAEQCLLGPMISQSRAFQAYGSAGQTVKACDLWDDITKVQAKLKARDSQGQGYSIKLPCLLTPGT